MEKKMLDLFMRSMLKYKDKNIVGGKNMTFDEFMEKVYKALSLREEAYNIREFWDDYGAVPGCGCGCGGDTFDWDGQSYAFEQADELDCEADNILEDLRKVWEAK